MREAVVFQVLLTRENELTIVTVDLSLQTLVVIVTPDLLPSLQVLVAVSAVVVL